MYYNRNLIGADKSAVTPRDASGIFDLRAQEKHQRNQSWPGSVDYYLALTINNSGDAFEVRQHSAVAIAIDWGDGSSETSSATTTTHTYSSSGIYRIKINTTSGTTYIRPRFDSASSTVRSQITKVEAGRYMNGSFDSSFRDCSNLQEIITPYSSFSGVTNFRRTFRGCSSLKIFPLIETKNITNFENFCLNCTSLTAFPKLDFTAAAKFNGAWSGCSSLTDFPPKMFDKTGNFTGTNNLSTAWNNCALTAQSIENILVSLDINGDTGITLGMSGGTNASYSTWSSAAQTALSNLQGKSWTVTYNT